MVQARMSKGRESDSIRTVQRALDILNCFTLQKSEWTLTEIAKEISLAKSTTTRLLATLEQNGFIEKNKDTLKYKLGQRLYFLGYIAGRSIQLREIAYPVMKRLRDETKETVNLYLLEDEYRTCIEQCEGLQSLRHLVKIGERLPLWAGAGGKVLLAYQDEEFQNRIFRHVESVSRLLKLKADLAKAREEGYAYSQDEREVGSSAVAAPIFDVSGKVKACISISGPTYRFTTDVIEHLRGILIENAAIVSAKCGYIKKEGNG